MPLPDQPAAAPVIPSKDPAQPPDPDPYWAAAASGEIAEKLSARFEAYGASQLVSTLYGRNARAHCYYFGMDPSGIHATSQIHRGGEIGELALIRVNHSRALVNALVNLILAARIVWEPKATNTDTEALAETELAISILEHFWHAYRVSKYVSRSTEESVPFTEAFVFTPWNKTLGEAVTADAEGNIVRSGDLEFINLSSWNVRRDPNKRSWEALEWLMVDVPRNRYALCKEYPAAKNAILENTDGGKEISTGQHVIGSEKPDDVLVCYFFHKPSAALPRGRQVIFLPGSKVKLYDSFDVPDADMGYDDFPVHRITPADLFGTPYGYSPYLEILGIQEMIDSIETALASNLSTFATQMVALDHGSEISPDDIGGLKIIYKPLGSKGVEPVQLTKSPPEAYEYLKEKKKDQELLMGLNAVVRGEMPANQKETSGAALALLQTQAVQQSSGFQANYIRFVESIGQCILDTLKRYCHYPRKVSLVGRQKSHLIRERSYDKNSFGRIKKVTVSVGNPMTQNAAGRFALAEMLVNKGITRSPEQVLQVIQYGQIDPLTQSLKGELLNIASENEKIAQGIKPEALIHDDHVLHCKEHRVEVASPVARENPAILKAAVDHMHEHYALYFGVPPTAPQLDPMGMPVPGPDGEPVMVPMDLLYRPRMLMLMGMQPPEIVAPYTAAPPPGTLPDPNMDTAGTPPLGPPEMGGPEGNLPDMPEAPTNPATGEKWNPAGGNMNLPQ